ncbi:MAG: winged helix-turn-helix transcriptional regulator [Spirochaetales bacterium]|nr:winged helix-turn-helix transcriptional regulator [Spirochaetales bacterium]
MEIKHNEAADLICAVFRLANRGNLRERKKDLGLEGLPQVEEWVEELENTLNPFLLSDVDLLVRKLSITSWNMVKLTRTPQPCMTSGDFLKRLSALNVEEYLSYVREMLSLSDEEPASQEKIIYALSETTSDTMVNPEEESEMILSMLKSPGAFLERIKNMYREFHEGPFKESQKRFRKLLEEKMEWHNNALKTDSTSYLDEITRQIYSTFFKKGPEPELFLSVYYDFDLYISTHNNMIVIGAGTDEIIKSKSNRTKTDVLFNILGDKKRLELLHLTSQRPWYSSELAEHFGITPATMSYHLNKMVSAGFVKLQHGDQKRYYYSINKDSLRDYLKAAALDLLGAEDSNE